MDKYPKLKEDVKNEYDKNLPRHILEPIHSNLRTKSKLKPKIKRKSFKTNSTKKKSKKVIFSSKIERKFFEKPESEIGEEENEDEESEESDQSEQSEQSDNYESENDGVDKSLISSKNESDDDKDHSKYTENNDDESSESLIEKKKSNHVHTSINLLKKHKKYIKQERIKKNMNKLKAISNIIILYYTIKIITRENSSFKANTTLKKFVLYYEKERIELTINNWIYNAIKTPYLSILKTNNLDFDISNEKNTHRNITAVTNEKTEKYVKLEVN